MYQVRLLGKQDNITNQVADWIDHDHHRKLIVLAVLDFFIGATAKLTGAPALIVILKFS